MIQMKQVPKQIMQMNLPGFKEINFKLVQDKYEITITIPETNR